MPAADDDARSAAPAIAAESKGTAASAQAVNDDAGDRTLRADELEERANLSFSGYPLGVETLGLNTQGMTTVTGSCDPVAGDNCGWVDGGGVIHYLDTNNMLWSKAVTAQTMGNRPIAALGIGTARERAAVVANVTRFLQGARLECSDAAKAGEGNGISSCGATLDRGWIKLLFDADNHLISAQIDAYQAD